MRIALAGISHEGLPASPLPTRLADFHIQRGEDVVRVYGQTRKAADLVPIFVAASTAPGGPVETAAYITLRDEIVQELRAQGPLDGVCLLLHGAMWVDGIGSGEADLVKHI